MLKDFCYSIHLSQCALRNFKASHKSLVDSEDVFLNYLEKFLDKYFEYPLLCEEGQIITIKAHL